jgi:hypothetical protein
MYCKLVEQCIEATGACTEAERLVLLGTAGGPRQQSTHAARFSFPGTPLPGFELARVIGSDLTGQTVLNQQPVIGLIGRDILANAILIYNGSAGMFSLSF